MSRNSENIRSLADAREESHEKKQLYQDYFKFLQESSQEVLKENSFEINFYDQDDIKKEDIPDFEKLILRFNENNLLKLKVHTKLKFVTCSHS